MPVNGGVMSLKKENKRHHEMCDEIEEPIDIKQNSFSLTSSSDSSVSSNEDLKKIKDALVEDRLKPVSLSIIDFYTDFHKKLKLLIESGLYFEYDEALIHYMVSYVHFGEIYEFSKIEIVEICEISEINPDVVYSRYTHLKSYMKKK
jgi:hypothetical protein